MISTVLVLSLASAQDVDRHQARFHEARQAESEGRFADAVAACQDSLDAWPEGPAATTCATRNARLEARRDTDGDFGGWTELSAIRADFRLLGADEARQRVLELAQRSDLSELVRVEVGLWLARDALARDDADSALEWTAPIVASHQGEFRKPAVGLHARILAELGERAEAVAVESEVRVPQDVRLTPVESVLRERAERRVAWAAGGVLALFGLVSGPLAWRGRTPGKPWGLVPIAVGALGAWLIAEGWTVGAGRAAPWMGVGFGLVHVLSGPALRGREGWQRAVVALLAGIATLAVGYLALWSTGTLGWVS